MPIKLLIVGGVAGGATAAARARRIDERAEIILFERGEHISFANCGLPYYIGDIIKKRNELLVTTPKAFKERYNIDIRVFHEVVSIDRSSKAVEVRDVKAGKIYRESYDKLILSPGAEPLRPPIKGIDHENIFTLRNIPDTDRIKKFIDTTHPVSAVVVGGGFIGLEMAENLVGRGIKTTIIEMLNQVMAPLDYEMAAIVQDHLTEKGVLCDLENRVTGFAKFGDKITVSTEKGREIACDMVILSIGIKPENTLAKAAGLAIGERGGIKVDAALQTTDPDIYAVGDAAEMTDFVTGVPVMTPLAGPANKEGRVAADNALGRKSLFKGTLATAVVKVFDLTVASTGNSEKILKRLKIPYQVSYTHSGSHASYYPGATMMAVKLIFSPGTGRILGAQIVGEKGVDKRIDVIATAIHGQMTVHDLEELELSYAPPFSSAKDPVNIAGFVAANLIKGDVKNVYWDELAGMDRNETVLVDLRTKKEQEKEGTMEGAIHIPVDQLREKLGELDKEKTYVLFCAIGLRGYVAHRILVQNGFKSKNLSGGFKLYKNVLGKTNN